MAQEVRRCREEEALAGWRPGLGHEDHPGTEVPRWFKAQPDECAESIVTRWRSFLKHGPPGGGAGTFGSLRSEAEAAGLAAKRTPEQVDVDDVDPEFPSIPGETPACCVARWKAHQFSYSVVGKVTEENIGMQERMSEKKRDWFSRVPGETAFDRMARWGEY